MSSNEEYQILKLHAVAPGGPPEGHFNDSYRGSLGNTVIYCRLDVVRRGVPPGKDLIYSFADCLSNSMIGECAILVGRFLWQPSAAKAWGVRTRKGVYILVILVERWGRSPRIP